VSLAGYAITYVTGDRVFVLCDGMAWCIEEGDLGLLDSWSGLMLELCDSVPISLQLDQSVVCL
jgi:D-arabinose 5-phosphate isomerase GutQ